MIKPTNKESFSHLVLVVHTKWKKGNPVSKCELWFLLLDERQRPKTRRTSRNCTKPKMYQTVSPPDIVHPVGCSGGGVSAGRQPEYDQNGITTNSGGTGGGCNITDKTPKKQTLDHHNYLLQWGQRKRSRCVRTESRDHKTASSSGTLHCNSCVNVNNRVVSGEDGSSASGSLLPSSKTTRSTAGRRSNNIFSSDTHGLLHHQSNRKMPVPGSTPKKLAADNTYATGQSGNHNIRDPVAILSERNGGGGEASEWPRIYVSLSRKEKEDDFYAMKGTKLPHRPKKRSKPVERYVQNCFPGLWLSDLTRARYEVRERKCAKKQKRRGLKGLESMDSDSD